jgi:hypothetical protein
MAGVFFCLIPPLSKDLFVAGALVLLLYPSIRIRQSQLHIKKVVPQRQSDSIGAYG